MNYVTLTFQNNDHKKIHISDYTMIYNHMFTLMPSRHMCVYILISIIITSSSSRNGSAQCYMTTINILFQRPTL